MKLSNCKSEKMLPLFMRNDSFDVSLCRAMDKIVVDLWSRIQSNLRFWDYIDLMTEQQLDECAYEFGVYWYRFDSNIYQKREIIKSCRDVKRKLGTVWAVEYVLSIYFNDAKIVEYWNYNGQRKHFKIQTYNTATVNEDATAFLKILDKIKRKAAVLDYIEVIEKSTNEIVYIIKQHTAEIAESKNIGGMI